MKTTAQCIISVLLTMITFNSFSQKYYIQAGAGYGFRAFSQELGSNNTKHYAGNSVSVINDSMVKGSFGSGINFLACFGYRFSEHIGGELGVTFVSGNKYESTFASSYYEDVNNSWSDNGSRATEAKLVRLMAAVKMSFTTGRFSPYVKAGVVFSVNGKIITEVNESYNEINFGNNSSFTIKIVTEYTDGNSVGGMAAAGTDYQLGTHVFIFGEAGFVAQTWAPTKGEVVKYIRDGVDQLSSLKTNQRQAVFVDSYSLTGTPDTSQPSKVLKHYYPFSSWGFNLGLRFSL